MRRIGIGGPIGAGAIWALGLVLPFALSSSWVSIAAFFAIYAITALSQDIILGRAGMFDMGHAVYFGIGAYVTAILNTRLNVPILLTLPPAMLLAAGVGALLAAPLIRLRGDYLLVATIGFNAIFVLAMQNDPGGITGGSDGITGIGVPSIFGLQLESQSAMFWLDWIILGFVLVLMRNLDRCEFGRALRYLKQDQLAAGTLGVDARAVKTLAFAVGAALAGLAGTLFAVQLSTVGPSSFVFTESVTLFAIVIVGGQGSIPGVLLGTALMFVVPQIFRGFAEYRYFVFGIAMIAVMVLRPQGLWPRRQKQGQGAPPPGPPPGTEFLDLHSLRLEGASERSNAPGRDAPSNLKLRGSGASGPSGSRAEPWPFL